MPNRRDARQRRKEEKVTLVARNLFSHLLHALRGPSADRGRAHAGGDSLTLLAPLKPLNRQRAARRRLRRVPRLSRGGLGASAVESWAATLFVRPPARLGGAQNYPE